MNHVITSTGYQYRATNREVLLLADGAHIKRGPERPGEGSWELRKPGAQAVTVWTPFRSEAFRKLRLAHFAQIGAA